MVFVPNLATAVLTAARTSFAALQTSLRDELTPGKRDGSKSSRTISMSVRSGRLRANRESSAGCGAGSNNER